VSARQGMLKAQRFTLTMPACVLVSATAARARYSRRHARYAVCDMAGDATGFAERSSTRQHIRPLLRRIDALYNPPAQALRLAVMASALSDNPDRPQPAENPAIERA
jgi:hypothetical protein